MSIDLNKAMIGGRLTRDPEMKALPSGQSVTNFSLATNRVWNDKDGNLQEEVQYHNVVVFARTAENVAKYLTKGSSAFVEGRLQTRSWENDGVTHYRTEIVADSVQFGDKGDKGGDKTADVSAGQYVTKQPDYPDGPEPEDVAF